MILLLPHILRLKYVNLTKIIIYVTPQREDIEETEQSSSHNKQQSTRAHRFAVEIILSKTTLLKTNETLLFNDKTTNTLYES
jgi:hypothetical protein